MRTRVFFLTVCIFAAFFIIVVRLWYLQIVQSESLSMLAENNRLRRVVLPDYRGNFFDRNGIELVSSRPSFNVALIREDIPDLDVLLAELGELIDLDKAAVKKKMLSMAPFSAYVAAYDITRDQAARIEERRYELPGVSLEIRPTRYYRYGPLAAHLLGYLSEITKSQLEFDIYKDYRQGDILGRYGVEKSFETALRGKKGRKIVEVDAAGRELRVVRSLPSGAGHDINLSIEYYTQLAAELALEGKRGAIVAIKPKTGEILAMANSPSFNPNKFARGVDFAYWSELINDEYHPLNNRAIQGQYPPGSTYKIVVAAAGLESGVIDEETRFFCPGYYKMGRKVYRCWKKGGHGKIGLVRAIAESCDVFFYNVGLKVGVNKIAEMAARFGLNVKSGIKLDHEKRGLVPTTSWKEKNRHEPWIAGETLSISIGQGFNLTTPLQMARVIAAVANDGKMPLPRLIRLPEDVDTGLESLGGIDVKLSPKTLALIRRGLFEVVNSKGGTGWRARIKGVSMAGKTGTSQVVRLREDDDRKGDEIPEKFRDHAWFVAYAPFDDPQIAVAVVVEHGGSGGLVAAPMAKQVIKTYLDGVGVKTPLSAGAS
ncbi:MAG: penicillin-binding protein 2 [Nitrospinota bacterium]